MATQTSKAHELDEFSNADLETKLREAKEALTRAIHKLPMKCRIVKREAGEG